MEEQERIFNMKMNDHNYLTNTIVLNKRRSHENKYTIKINFRRHSKNNKHGIFNHRNSYYENIIL